MANDIILTDEEQAERVKAWWKKNGTSVITGALIGIAAIAGYNYWQTQKNDGLEQASAQYSLLLGAMNTPDSATARELSQSILDDHAGTVYGTKAALVQAKLYADSGDLANALDSLLLAKNNSAESGLTHVANLRIVRIYLEQGEIELAEAALNSETNRVGFESQYLELEGDIAYAQGDVDLAREKYTSASESLTADPGYANVLQIKSEALGTGSDDVVADVQFEISSASVSPLNDTPEQSEVSVVSDEANSDETADDAASTVESIQN